MRVPQHSSICGVFFLEKFGDMNVVDIKAYKMQLQGCQEGHDPDLGMRDCCGCHLYQGYAAGAVR